MPEAAIDALLTEARRGLARVAPAELAREVAAGALVVDTRPVEQRLRDGELPSAVVVDRDVLGWRLDPTSPHRIPEVDDPGRRVVIVRDEDEPCGSHPPKTRPVPVTDLEGGFQAWRAWTAGSSGRGRHRAEPSLTRHRVPWWRRKPTALILPLPRRRD